MTLRETSAYHIENLMDINPDAQVVELAVAERLEQENAALKAELEAVNINKIKADAIREAVSQPNWNELDDGSIFYRESDLLEYADKIEAGE